jgi:hypothetical protein
LVFYHREFAYYCVEWIPGIRRKDVLPEEQKGVCVKYHAQLDDRSMNITSELDTTRRLSAVHPRLTISPCTAHAFRSESVSHIGFMCHCVCMDN